MAFSIHFLGDPLAGSTVGDAALYGEIILGEEQEGFQSLIGFWSPLDYRNQWLQGLRRLVRERRSSCLITSLDDPATGETVWRWLLYPDGDIVHVREALFFPGNERSEFSTSDPYSSIPPRHERGAEGEEISEWDVPLEEFADFLDANEGQR